MFQHRTLQRVTTLLMGAIILFTAVAPTSTVAADASILAPKSATTAFVQTGAEWQYLDNGSTPSSSWSTAASAPSGWKTGKALFGYGNGGETTVISFGRDSKRKYPVTYFRKNFSVTGASSYSRLNLSLTVDDGAVIFLNGTEIYRSDNLTRKNNLPYTDGHSCADGSKDVQLSVSGLREGANVLAVEVHNCTASSSDLAFDLALSGESTGVVSSPTSLPTLPPTAAPTQAPTLAPTQPPATATSVPPTAAPTTVPPTPAFVAVNPNQLIAPNATWDYLASGTAPSSTWKSAATVTGWRSGPAILGYGNGSEATVLPYGSNANSKYPITYFRKVVSVANPAAFSALRVRMTIDDGAIVYVNGTEAFRTPNLSRGSNLPYTDGYACAESTVEATLDPRLLRAGSNLIAVEAHNCTASSSDLAFGLELNGDAALVQPTTVPTLAPTATATLPPMDTVTPTPTFLPVVTQTAQPTVTTNATFVADNATWQFYDGGTPAGTWKSSATVSGWASGQALLGFPASDVTTGTRNAAVVYFRTSFNASGVSALGGLTARLTVDDGAIVYINGVEAFRTPNLSSGSNLPYTDAYACGSQTVEASLSPTLLREGSNLVAVEVHNCTSDSSDLEFGLRLSGSANGVVLPPSQPQPTSAPTQPTAAPTLAPTQAPTQAPTLPVGNGDAFYAAPNGSSSGDGSQGRPWDIQTAFSKTGTIGAGDTLFLRGGTYGGGGDLTYRSTLYGSAGNNVTVRAYPGERPVVNASIEVQGHDVTFWGLEITNTDTDRTSTQTGSHPSDISRNMGFNVFAPNSKFINNIIHDSTNGVGFWRDATNSEMYGNIIFNNGYDSPDRGHGHGIYSQNETGTKRIIDNIVLNNFSNYNLHIYGESVYLRNFVIQGNVFFNGYSRVAGGLPSSNITMSDNHFYNGRVLLGSTSSSANNTGLTLTNNWFYGGQHDSGALEFRRWSNFTVTGNQFWNGSQLNLNYYSNGSGTLNNNRYFTTDSTPFAVNGSARNWTDWKSATGFDRDSSMATASPTAQQVIVRPNAYETQRAHVTVYNWGRANTVTVDLASAGFRSGDHYVLRNAQNLSEKIEGTYSGPISVPMTGWTVARPNGWSSPLQPSTFPAFGVFLATTW